LPAEVQDLPQRLIEATPDAIIFADCSGAICLWNPSAEILFGYTAEEAVGNTLDLIVPEPFRAAHWAGFHRAIERRGFANDESLLTSRTTTKDGRTIYVELSAAIICNDADQPIGIMAIGRDVTERHKRA
jgi:PAS domain S-box-containing protein